MAIIPLRGVGPQAFSAVDLHVDGQARKLARALACDGRRVLKDDRY
ncbi:hypothetical protein ACIPC1_17070 [Streptomyces sp. NPDC087263]